MATALVVSTGVANPLIILDEIEKAATSKHNGNLLDALLPFLEPRSASKYHDIFVQATVDLSGVVWIATANDAAPLPKPFRDRCRMLAFPSPTRADVPTVVPRLLDAIVTAKGMDKRWILPINANEMAALSAAWSDGSLRSLQRLLEGVLSARDQWARRH
jgi:ATP-dependent Lon protease